MRSVVSVVHLWFLSNREANKLRHIKNGNTNWYQSYKILKGTNLTFGCLNCGGLQNNMKRQHTASLGLDIIVLTETHLQQQMLHTESEQFTEYYCLWGSSPNDWHFSGVAILAKKSSFWAAKPFNWSEDEECFQ